MSDVLGCGDGLSVASGRPIGAGRVELDIEYGSMVSGLLRVEALLPGWERSAAAGGWD